MTMGWAWDIARKRKMKNKCKALIQTTERKRSLGKVSVGEGILVKWMLVRVLMMWTDIMWFKIGSNCGLLRIHNGRT